MTLNELTGPGASATASRFVVWAVVAIAAIVFLGTLVLGTIGVAANLSSGTIGVTLSTQHALPPEADAGSATLLSGTFETAQVVVGGLEGGTFAVVLAAKIVMSLTQLAIAASVVLLGWSMLRETPFRRSLSLTVGLSGGVVLVGGIIHAGLSVLGSWMTADQLNAPDDGLEGFWPIMAAADPTFIAIGITLLLAGLALEYGERLQRDTAGLV